MAQAAPSGRFELLDDDGPAALRPSGGGTYAQSSVEQLQGFLDNPKVPEPLKGLMREELASRPAAGAAVASGPQQAPSGRFELLDDDPAPTAATSPTGFATREQREGSDKQLREGEYLADAVRTRLQQDNASPLGRVDAFMRGAASWVPGMDKLAAAGDAAFGAGQGESFGDRYDDNLLRQRAMDEADRQLNPGSRYVGQGAGLVATGALLPNVAVARGAGVVPSAVNAGATGATYGAVTGAIENDGGIADKAQAAAEGGALGAVIGAPLGAAAGAIAPRAVAPIAAAGPDVAAAAERIGVNVPRAVATDSLALQRAAQGARNVPFAGEPIVRATGDMLEGLGRSADDVAAGMGSGDRAQAGATASGAIRNWITGRSAEAVSKAYDDVDRALDQSVRTELAATRDVIAEIAARRQNARIQGESRAISEVLPAVQAPGGLNYAGIKDLRTRIGELQKGGLLPSDISGAELSRLYGALSTDLRSAAGNAGGQRGLQLFERANSFNAAVAKRREELAKIVGTDGDAPAEAVFDRLARYAGEKGGADISRLAKARNAIGSDWDEVVSGVVSRMGRDAEGNFTPDRFVTAWGSLSPAGKSVLFSNKAHREALEDIFTVSSRAKDVYKKFGNPSGTAQNVGFGAALAGMWAEPVTTIGTLVGGNVLTRILAQPATASSMAKWSRAYQNAVTRPAAATAASLQIATRNLSSTIGDQLGVRIVPQEILRAISGPRMSPASDGQPDQEEQR